MASLLRPPPWWPQAALLLLGMLPLIQLLQRAMEGSLGADPPREIVLFTGLWALRLLAATLAISPLRRLPKLGGAGLLRCRRSLGLLCLFYASLHMLAYLALLLGWDLMSLADELVEHPWLLLGGLAWLLMVPLGLTSTRAMQRRLGRRWKQLHRLVYIAALSASIHFLWLSKDIAEPLLYAALFSLLLGSRLLPSRARGARG